MKLLSFSPSNNIITQFIIVNQGFFLLLPSTSHSQKSISNFMSYTTSLSLPPSLSLFFCQFCLFFAARSVPSFVSGCVNVKKTQESKKQRYIEKEATKTKKKKTEKIKSIYNCHINFDELRSQRYEICSLFSSSCLPLPISSCWQK